MPCTRCACSPLLVILSMVCQILPRIPLIPSVGFVRQLNQLMHNNNNDNNGLMLKLQLLFSTRGRNGESLTVLNQVCWQMMFFNCDGWGSFKLFLARFLLLIMTAINHIYFISFFLPLLLLPLYTFLVVILFYIYFNVTCTLKSVLLFLAITTLSFIILRLRLLCRSGTIYCVHKSIEEIF